MSAKNKVKKKIERISEEPNNPKIIFLISKLKIKYIKDNKLIIMKICPVGACLVKKDITKIMGNKNQ